MPAEIRKLAAEWLRDPAHVQVALVAAPAELVEQSVYFVEPRHKPHLLAHFLQNTAFTRTLVFARTKHGADKIAKQLVRAGIRALAIHGNKSQSVRQRTLDAFKSSRPPVLVATDVAARGLDVEGISHVVNYDLPDVPEMYIHRIGRTGRAGATGIAISFCAGDERDQLRQIERLTRRTLPVEQNQPDYPHDAAPTPDRSRRPTSGRSRGRSKQSRPAPRTELATASAGGSRTGSNRNGSGRPGNGRHRRPARARRYAL